MATIATWDPSQFDMEGTNFPELEQLMVSDVPRWVAWFDASTDEKAYLHFVAPDDYTGALTLTVFYIADTATSGTFEPAAALEAITPGDSLDLDSANSFDTINNAAADTVPGTAGHLGSVSITLTNDDGIAAGDLCRIELIRDVSEDSATGDIGVVAVELQDAA